MLGEDQEIESENAFYNCMHNDPNKKAFHRKMENIQNTKFSVGVVSEVSVEWIVVSKDEVKIDSIAGPSEIAIIADKNANSTFIAADMMSQAEHGTGFEASTTFCLSETQAQEIRNEINCLCKENKAGNSYMGWDIVMDSHIAFRAEYSIGKMIW